MSLLEYVLDCEQNFSFFILRFELSDIEVNCNRISKHLLSLRPISMCYTTKDDISAIQPNITHTSQLLTSLSQWQQHGGVHTFEADTTCMYEQDFVRCSIRSILEKCANFGFDPTENLCKWLHDPWTRPGWWNLSLPGGKIMNKKGSTRLRSLQMQTGSDGYSILGFECGYKTIETNSSFCF
jgi:hypothetical protein